MYLKNITALISCDFSFCFHFLTPYVFFVSIWLMQLFWLCHFISVYAMLKLKIENPFGVVL